MGIAVARPQAATTDRAPTPRVRRSRYEPRRLGRAPRQAHCHIRAWDMGHIEGLRSRSPDGFDPRNDTAIPRIDTLVQRVGRHGNIGYADVATFADEIHT
jgi:hypothetical protein